MDLQAQSQHFSNMYTVRDRVDDLQLPDSTALPDLSALRVADLLPSKDDHRAITGRFAILASRVLKKYKPFFICFASGLEKHIKHKYYHEMSQKSEVVSGIPLY